MEVTGEQTLHPGGEGNDGCEGAEGEGEATEGNHVDAEREGVQCVPESKEEQGVHGRPSNE